MTDTVMKRIFTPIAVAAIAVYSFAACSIAEQAGPAEASKFKHPIVVKFTTEPQETKTAFAELEDGQYPAYWTANDQSLAMSLNLATPVEATVNKAEETSRNADFTAVFEDKGKPYTFYALSPLSAVNSISASRSSWAVSIPTVQTPTADSLSCDEAAMLLYAASEEVQAIPSIPIELQFSHVTAYCRLALKNIATALQTNNVTDATVKSVVVTYSVPVAGEWYVNVADGSLEEKEASYSITIKPTVSDLSQPTDIWFALAPVVLDGVSVKVSVNTDKGSLSRSYTYGTRTYSAGSVNKLSLDMTKNSTFEEYSAAEEEVYALVTSLSDLSVDDEVIFVNSTGAGYAMTSTAASTVTNGFTAVAKDATTGFTYSSEDGYIRLPEGSTVLVLTVASKSSSSFTFKSGSKYLGTTASGSTHYPVLGSSAKTFTLSISSGTSTLSYKSSSGKTTYSLYYVSNYFKMYGNSSSTKSLAIFKKTTVGGGTSDPDEDPILENEQYGAYLSSGNTIHESGATQISREYGASEVTFAILNSQENTVLEFIGIPVSAAQGDTFSLILMKNVSGKRTSLGTFDVRVVREEGAKLWLSDGAGNGFIVKR